MLQRFLLVGLLLLALAGGGYYYFKPSPQALSLQALDYLKQDNLKKAETILNSLPPQSTSHPIAFYKGCIAQTTGRLREAGMYFQIALKEPCKGNKEAVVFEIALAQAMNAFLEGRDADFCTFAEAAASVNPSSAYSLFFHGTSNYMQGRFEKALLAWSTFSTSQTESGSPWFHTLFERVFSSSWQQIHMAHCLIEQGDLILGKEILEKESACHHPELPRLAALFLGYAYLKEGCQMPIDQRGSFYKLAHFYFDRGGTSLNFNRERNLLISPLRLEAEQLLLANLPSEQLPCLFDLIHILQKWNAQEAIADLAEHFSHTLLQQAEAEKETLCQTLRREFMGNLFLATLNQKLIDSLSLSLHIGKGEELIQMWSLIQSLSNSPGLVAKQLAALTTEEIFSAVQQDSDSLVITKQYIAFWNHLDHSQQDLERLVKNLLLQAKLFWQKEGQESKGKELMSICLDLSEHHSSTLKEIEVFLNDLYIRAEESNLIERLSFIYDAMCSFDIQKKDLISPSKLANHLADADYLYHSQNYTAAITHAGWVLKLDPSNQHAIKLVGLSSFHLGEYGRSFIVLSRLSNPDENCYKALVLSQVLSNQEPAHHLAQINPLITYDNKSSD